RRGRRLHGRRTDPRGRAPRGDAPPGQHVAAAAPAQGRLLARGPAHGPARAARRGRAVQRQQGARRARGPELAATEGLRVIVSKPPSTRDAQPHASPSIAFVTLGCPKNTVDSEHMLGALVRDGFRTVADPDGADVAVINTCAFLQSAVRESKGVITSLCALKARRRLKAVI